MFSRAFLTDVIAPNAVGEPGIVAQPVTFATHLIEPRLVLFNALAATIQLLIGLGLVYRRSVRTALLISFGWAAGVWWIGEGLGGLLTGGASPLTGAPGPALLYVLAGLIVWPYAKPDSGSAAAAGLLGERGARAAWAILWFGSAALWLLPANLAAGSVQDAFASAPSGARWLSSVESMLASASAGRGVAIAVAAASMSAAVAGAVLLGRSTRLAVVVSVLIALIYFVAGQGLGGMLTGSGTDPGSGPLLALIGISLYPISGRARRNRSAWLGSRPR
jgi:hypothetical protein